MTKFKKLLDNFKRADFLMSNDDIERAEKERQQKLNSAIGALKKIASSRDANNQLVNLAMCETAKRLRISVSTFRSYLNMLSKEKLIIKISENTRKQPTYKITPEGQRAALLFSKRGKKDLVTAAKNNSRFYSLLKEYTKERIEPVPISRTQLAKDLELSAAAIIRCQNDLVAAGKIEAISQQGCITRYRVLP